MFFLSRLFDVALPWPSATAAPLLDAALPGPAHVLSTPPLLLALIVVIAAVVVLLIALTRRHRRKLAEKAALEAQEAQQTSQLPKK